MAFYRVEVVETRTVDVIYLVEADSENEARQKAENGETVDEDHPVAREIINRSVFEVELTTETASLRRKK